MCCVLSKVDRHSLFGGKKEDPNNPSGVESHLFGRTKISATEREKKFLVAETTSHCNTDKPIGEPVDLISYFLGLIYCLGEESYRY